MPTKTKIYYRKADSADRIITKGRFISGSINLSREVSSLLSDSTFVSEPLYMVRTIALNCNNENIFLCNRNVFLCNIQHIGTICAHKKTI